MRQRKKEPSNYVPDILLAALVLDARLEPDLTLAIGFFVGVDAFDKEGGLLEALVALLSDLAR